MKHVKVILAAIFIFFLVGAALAASMVGAALTFVIGRGCAKLLGWY